MPKLNFLKIFGTKMGPQVDPIFILMDGQLVMKVLFYFSLKKTVVIS
jgi:hypothetical protein